MADEPLKQLDAEKINNVYIFLADALRFEYLPNEVADLGLSFKTVAHALTTPQCLPTISSGLLPPKHGVTWFNHTVPKDLPTFFDLKGYNTGYSELLWPGGALRDVLGQPDKLDIETAEEPFIVFEHDNGGHAPYPERKSSSPSEMLRSMKSRDEAVSAYRETVSGSAERFKQRLSILDDRGVLDNTLVIFLADHGELLGEYGGFFGHQLPMTPELVYVPTVFVHPSLPAGERGQHLLKQADLYPTIVEVLTGKEVDSDGQSLTEPVGDDRATYSKTIVQPPRKYHGTIIDPAYEAHSIWTKAGGHVFVDNSKIIRAITAIYEGTQSGHTAAYNSHRNIVQRLSLTLPHYLRDRYQYGEPKIERKEARKLSDNKRRSEYESKERNLSEETKRQLSNLGYR
ncbi:sulfatase-like hydrolase/transferase [Halovenus salina]|uniref:Sulfatase-like hydrolase/transferase n=1 Tax=Halovenus salina TaxID=1510225 RepID=A0ABD5W213_9EURY|nr:sulfatase-like hydrolase/transferase [Halovenus salina]